jgi:hypothetical protein
MVDALTRVGEDLERLLDLLGRARCADLLHGRTDLEDASAQFEARTFVALSGALPRRAVGLFARLGLGLAGLGEREHAATFDVLALDEALVLEELQCRVDRAGARAPHAAAALFEPLHDLVPVHRLFGEHREDRRADVAAARPGPGAAAMTVGPMRAMRAELEACRRAFAGTGLRAAGSAPRAAAAGRVSSARAATAAGVSW